MADYCNFLLNTWGGNMNKCYSCYHPLCLKTYPTYFSNTTCRWNTEKFLTALNV